jgi:hypothetical protein
MRLRHKIVCKSTNVLLAPVLDGSLYIVSLENSFESYIGFIIL